MNSLLCYIRDIAAVRWPLFAFSLSALMLLDACAVNPATGSPNLVLMSGDREKEIGLEEHQKIVQSSIFYEDEAMNEYVTEIGNRVAQVGDRPDLEYQFFIIDSPEINAFALPGGYVYVNRGLITFLNSEAELAGVLAHEVAHITARHSVQQHASNTLARTAAQVGGLATAVITGSGYVGSQISQVASIWAQAGLSGFGREHELEADELGAEYLRDAGYDPIGMIDALAVLKNHQDFMRLTTNRGGGYHGLFATHPRSDQRLQQIIAQVRDFDPQASYIDDNSRFREATEGLIVGESRLAKTNETRNRYYQTLLGYTMVFPDNWLVSETTTTATGTGSGEGSLRVEALRLQNNVLPQDFLLGRMHGAALEQSETLEQFRLRGHTGIVQDSANRPQGTRRRDLFRSARLSLPRGIACQPGRKKRTPCCLSRFKQFPADRTRRNSPWPRNCASATSWWMRISILPLPRPIPRSANIRKRPCACSTATTPSAARNPAIG